MQLVYYSKYGLKEPAPNYGHILGTSFAINLKLLQIILIDKRCWLMTSVFPWCWQKSFELYVSFLVLRNILSISRNVFSVLRKIFSISRNICSILRMIFSIYWNIFCTYRSPHRHNIYITTIQYLKEVIIKRFRELNWDIEIAFSTLSS